jgi:hypothetical protein
VWAKPERQLSIAIGTFDIERLRIVEYPSAIVWSSNLICESVFDGKLGCGHRKQAFPAIWVASSLIAADRSSTLCKRSSTRIFSRALPMNMLDLLVFR